MLVRLLEADLRIEGISGASGGALNAVVLASGWLRGGSAGAAQALDELWREIGALAQISPLRAAVWASWPQTSPPGSCRYDRRSALQLATRPWGPKSIRMSLLLDLRARLEGGGRVAGTPSPATLDHRGSGR